MSTFFASSSLRARYLTRSVSTGPHGPYAQSGSMTLREDRPRPGVEVVLLAVELDDELLLDLGVDDLPLRQAVHQDLELARDELEPRRDGLAAGETLGDLEGRELLRLLAHLHDVVLAQPV